MCAPSRAAIITGMYQSAIGAQHMRTTEDRVPELPGPYLAVPPHYVKAFPEYLRAAGYYTSNRAKTDYQFGVPFTIWDDLGPAAHWRNRTDKSQPFFSVFNLEVTHESQIFPIEPRAQREAARHRSREASPCRRTIPTRRSSARSWRACTTTSPTWTRRSARFCEQLEADGLADNTIVFYWSDHGDGVPRSKRSLYDSGLRVPLMIRWPEALGAAVAEHRQRSARQLRSIWRRRSSRSRGVEIPAHLQGRVLVGPKAGAGAGVRLRRARPDGHRVRHDALGARRAVSLHPQLRARAALRRPHHLPQPERHHAGVVQAAGGRRVDGRRRRCGCAPAVRPRSCTTRRPIRIRFAICPPRWRIAQTLERYAQGGDADWMTRIDDQGLINEAEMIQRMWPGGVQPETAQPYIVPRRERRRLRRAASP